MMMTDTTPEGAKDDNDDNSSIGIPETLRRVAISDYYRHGEEDWLDVFRNILPSVLLACDNGDVSSGDDDENNTPVGELVLDRRDFIEALNATQMADELWIMIGQMPRLERLCMTFVQQPGEPLPLPMTALTQLLRPQQLTYLEIAWVCLQGRPEEWQQLLQVLRGHHCLQEVKFRNLCLNPRHQQPQPALSLSYHHQPQPQTQQQQQSSTTNTTRRESTEASNVYVEPQLQDLFQVLAGLPVLEEIFVLDAHRIIHDWKMPDPSGAMALQSLVRSSSLQTLCLMLPLSNYQVQQLSLELHDNANDNSTSNTLERLALFRCQVDDDACRHLATMLQRNTRLQILRLDDNLIGSQGCIALARAMRTNTSLRILDLKGNGGIGPAGYQALCDMLEYDNFGLMGLEMEDCDDDDDDAVPPATVTDKAATSPPSISQIQAKIRLFLRLNEQARKVFLRHVNHRALFVDCLAHFGREPDFLFYYLQANPVVCQVDF